MSVITRLIPDNPVLTKELRVRMRGARAYWILLGYLGFLAVLLLIRYSQFSSSILQNGTGGSNSAEFSKELFAWIIIPQVFLVLFITPAITSGTLTIEREQQTMDLLTMTRLTRRSIVIGKLLSAVAFTALLILSSLPLLSVCFMLGSIDPGYVFSTYLEMLAASVLIGAMGIMWSSIARTTTQAVIFTYITLFLVFIFGLVAFLERMNPFGATAAANAFRAISEVWFGPNFLGIKTTGGLGFSVICLMTGILMTAVATIRLEMFPDRKAYILRGLTLLLFFIQFLALDIWWVNAWYVRGNAAVMTAVQPPIGVLMLTALALMLVIPIFATGDLAPFEARRFPKYMLSGWTLKGLKRGKLASGLPFLVVLTLVCIGIYALSFVFAGKTHDIMHSGALSFGLPGVPPPPPPTLVGSGPSGSNSTLNGNTVTQMRSDGSQKNVSRLPNGKVQVMTTMPNGSSNIQIVSQWPSDVPTISTPPPPSHAPPPSTGDLMQGVVMLLAFVFGFSLLCMFFSIAFRSRWISMLLAYVLILIVLLVPQYAMSSAYSQADTSLTINLFYLNPAQAFIQMSEPATFWSSRFLLFDQTPMWLATTWTWVLIGLLSFLGALPFIRRESRLNAPIPYEELVALA